jgi:Fe-S cluster assembly protein SufD
VSAALQHGAQALLARYEALREQLPGDAGTRAAAAAAFGARGLPGVREEAWKYTNLRPLADLTSTATAPASAAVGGQLLARLPAMTAPRLVFVDGKLSAELSVPPIGVESASFAVRPEFGALARPDRDSLVALNTMLAEDGAILRVPAGVDAGVIVMASLASAVGGQSYPRHGVALGPGARLVLIDMSTGLGSYLHNAVFEISVAAGATLTHVRLQDEAADAVHIATLYAEMAEHATYDSFTLVLGGRLARTEVHARLAGERGVTHLNAAQLLGGTQHADVTTVVRHDAPHCASRQAVKNVLLGHARGVFQSRIEVARGAQKTDGYQMNQALLLSPDAEIDSKPELEIFADDVKCSHGATVGELDPAQLFYLRSRGIPEREARAILVRAFLAEALEAISHEGARVAMEQSVDRWWERQAA